MHTSLHYLLLTAKFYESSDFRNGFFVGTLRRSIPSMVTSLVAAQASTATKSDNP